MARSVSRFGKTSGRVFPTHEVPITSITNGIHTKTWMAPEFSALYTKYLGALGRTSDRA